MSYNIKIDKRTTSDGITSWLEWTGFSFNAWAEKVAKDGMFKVTRSHMVPHTGELVRFLPSDELRYTTPELFARKQAEAAVRKDWEKRVVEYEPAANGGW